MFSIFDIIHMNKFLYRGVEHFVLSLINFQYPHDQRNLIIGIASRCKFIIFLLNLLKTHQKQLIGK